MSVPQVSSSQPFCQDPPQPPLCSPNIHPTNVIKINSTIGTRIYNTVHHQLTRNYFTHISVAYQKDEKDTKNT